MANDFDRKPLINFGKAKGLVPALAALTVVISSLVALVIQYSIIRNHVETDGTHISQDSALFLDDLKDGRLGASIDEVLRENQKFHTDTTEELNELELRILSLEVMLENLKTRVQGLEARRENRDNISQFEPGKEIPSGRSCKCEQFYSPTLRETPSVYPPIREWK